jgi:ABC-2 type transport system permease protein
VQQSSPILYQVCLLNPFTYAVELARFCLYGTLNPLALAVVIGCTIVFTAGAILAYDPARGVMARRPGAAA